jgi:hypothetical protein
MFYILNSASVTATVTANTITLDGTSNGYDDNILYGTIVDGADVPVVGALVRISKQTGTDPAVVLGFAYSGCTGDYMFVLDPATMPLATDTVIIEVVGTDLTREPVACAT